MSLLGTTLTSICTAAISSVAAGTTDLRTRFPSCCGTRLTLSLPVFLESPTFSGDLAIGQLVAALADLPTKGDPAGSAWATKGGSHGILLGHTQAWAADDLSCHSWATPI